MSLLLSTLLFSQAAALSGDSITFELVTGATNSSGWELRSDETGKVFDNDKVRQIKPQAFKAEPGSFAFATGQLARYRPLAKPGEGQPLAASDVVAFRLTWIEGGKRFTASFADSSGGVPTDLLDTLRPIGERLDKLLAAPEHAVPSQ